MNDYVDYVIETSNDNFLEAIEAISRSHKEYMRDDFQQIQDIEASLSEEMCEPGLFYTENNEFQHKSKIYSTALKDNDSDYLNVTDCDFNFMVDPRTGRRLYDNENCQDEFDNDILDNDVQHDSSDSHGDNDCIKIEVDGDFDNNSIKKPLDIPSTVENHLSPKGNKTVLMEIANSPCNTEKSKQTENPITIKSQRSTEKYSKPPFSYSCLIAMALKNSESGYLPVSEIYSYMTEKYPYFKTAPDGWKNSVRHNLSLNKCFQKLETPLMNGASRKACLWGLNEAKLKRLNEEISKWIKIEPDCTVALRLDSKELDERASDDFGNSLLMEANEDQHQFLLSSPTSRTAKDRKKFANSKKTKKFDIKVESLNDISQNNALFSEEDQDWDDIDIKPKSTSSYYHYPSDNSQSAFDSSLFKTVRASA